MTDQRDIHRRCSEPRDEYVTLLVQFVIAHTHGILILHACMTNPSSLHTCGACLDFFLFSLRNCFLTILGTMTGFYSGVLFSDETGDGDVGEGS
jgi:hypothetical protein